jgi:insertion element IS1 protein InsB
MVKSQFAVNTAGRFELVRNGYAPNGKQRYRCKACKRQSRENPAPNGYTEERREEIIRSYQERSSMRGLTRTFGVSRNTVKVWLKKSSATPSRCRETLVAPDPNDESATILELDELWSFVLKRRNQVWIWIALCRKTRQVVARAIGDRSEKTCQELWDNIPDEYRKGHCFADLQDQHIRQSFQKSN